MPTASAARGAIASYYLTARCNAARRGKQPIFTQDQCELPGDLAAQAPVQVGCERMVDMNEPKWLSPVERDAWLALVSVTTLLPAALDSELQVQAKITLFDYNVLAMLSEAPEHILAMSELASRTSASLSRLSHVVKKLEGRGWVQRSRSPEDARVTIAQLSDEGWEMVQTLAPEHVSSVRQLIFQGLDEGDIAELARIGQKLVGRLAPDHWILR